MEQYFNSLERLRGNKPFPSTLIFLLLSCISITKPRRFMFLLVQTKYSGVWEASAVCFSTKKEISVESIGLKYPTWKSMNIFSLKRHLHFYSISVSVIWVSFNQGLLNDMVVGWNGGESKNHMEVFISQIGIISLERSSTTLSPTFALSYLIGHKVMI